MEQSKIRNNEKYCNILAVNAVTHIRLIQLILMTTIGTAVNCDTWEHIATVLGSLVLLSID